MKQIGNAQLYHGDSREVLKGVEENSLHACVCDPPYALNFMAKAWDRAADNIAFDPSFWALVLKVLRPGGHVLAFGGTRTAHRMACALEDAGFEIRDSILCPGLIGYCYGSGFPKSHDVSKAIDKMAGAERRTVGIGLHAANRQSQPFGQGAKQDAAVDTRAITAPATPAAQEWQGWGSALKPAWEPIYLCRKPLSESSIAANVLRWSTGALNIDACRIGTGAKQWASPRGGIWQTDSAARAELVDNEQGRFPSNLLLVHSPTCTDTDCVESCPVRELGRQSGEVRSAGNYPATNMQTQGGMFGEIGKVQGPLYEDEGTAARFFAQFRYSDVDDLPPFIYCAKSSTSDREKGCEGLAVRDCGTYDGNASQQESRKLGNSLPGPRANIHPTCKPTALMAYLCRLVCPPGGVVLDPFMGSGSTLVAAQREGFRSVGIEQSAEYYAIACKRVADSANLCGLFAEDP